ncbi:protein smoothened isoform X2 [Microplitis demolitor]|uniref:protein smoothened isoform X2 n=1 Tax=Microplitis demolitor TaxID=69319 RepID=UPI0004CDA2D8|nr:protein smoothened isoform X2 [Microplitis demolitor]
MHCQYYYLSKISLCSFYCIFILSAKLTNINAETSGIYERNEIIENDRGESLYPYDLRSYSNSVECRRPATCVKLEYNTCMGTVLPYTMSTLDLLPEGTTQDLIAEQLRLLQGLQHIPKCWAVVQPLLCSLFMPKCDNNVVELPSQEMCKKILNPCRIVMNHTIWPSFIKCDNKKLFPKLCKDISRELQFNTSGRCLKPLVPTDNSLATFEGIEGCGTQCNDPLYTIDEHKQIHSFIKWGAIICMCFHLFTIFTFLIDWRSANKYPSLVIFYINCCFLISCIGWILQFTSVTRDSIICHKDNTLRIKEPSGGNLFCVMVFVLIYYPSMAALVWFVILTYAWHMRFQSISTIQDKIDKKSAYFHLIAWCCPLVLTVTIITLCEVDGNSVTGICFVGYTNHIVRAGFVLGPTLISSAVGEYFLSRGLITLIRLKIKSHSIVSERANSKIRGTIIRMGCFSVLIFFTVIITFYCHIYDFQNSWKWHQSFREYILCSIIKYEENLECKIASRPSINKLQLHLLSPFLAGVLMSLWVWTSSTVETWKRFFRRTFNREPEEPVKLKKHRVIAQAFAKRKTFNNKASQDFSSTWAAALPKFVTRRGALIGGNAGSVSSNRRNSVDSEISFSVQRVSVQSRRNSVDSQYSYQIAEVKATRKRKPNPKPRKQLSNRKIVQSSISTIGPLFKRGSATSLNSQHGAQILSALTIGGTSQIPGMKRRSATAGLDESGFNSELMHNAGMLLPFFFPGDSDSDENSSIDQDKNPDSESKIVIVENINIEEDEHYSESEDSQVDEETKMLDSEEPESCTRSKNSDKSSKRFSHDSEKSRETQKSKFIIQNETILKHFLQASNDTKIEKENVKDLTKKTNISNLSSSLNSCCPELVQNMQLDAQSSAREIATQTSLPIDILEMEELKQSIDEIINSRNSSSKTTQKSPQSHKSNNRKTENKTMSTNQNSVPRILKESHQNEKIISHKNV